MKLTKGTSISMTDGWLGRVEQVRGDVVIAYRDGYAPNDRLAGCRTFGLSMATLDGNKAVVAWSKSATKPPPKPVDLDKVRREREREKLEASWAGALH